MSTSRKLVIGAKVSKDERYPKSLITIGDHLRTARLDRNLEMKEAAVMLGVSNSALFDWEHNQKHPSFKYLHPIITFIGYEPEAFHKKRVLVEEFERLRKENNWSIHYCANQMEMCYKQLKKLLNLQMELSDMNRERILSFLS